MSANINQVMINSQAHQGMQGGSGGGGEGNNKLEIGVQSDAVQTINAVANSGTIAFANVLKGLDQASPLKDIQFGLMKPPPSLVNLSGRSHGIMGSR